MTKTNELPNQKGLDAPLVSNCPSKLILVNHTELSMQDFLILATEVVKMGRISKDNKQYCYLTSFKINNEDYHIASDLNNKSDKLTFYKVPTHS
jgi:hypothetical protein